MSYSQFAVFTPEPAEPLKSSLNTVVQPAGAAGTAALAAPPAPASSTAGTATATADARTNQCAGRVGRRDIANLHVHQSGHSGRSGRSRPGPQRASVWLPS